MANDKWKMKKERELLRKKSLFDLIDLRREDEVAFG